MAKLVRLSAALVLTAASISLAACGGGQSLSQNSAGGTVVPVGAARDGSIAPSNAAAQNWSVLAGGNVHDQAFQALDFFDENITIDAGDSITWTANGADEPHTVTFLGPVLAPPPPGDPANALPAGGSRYDGGAYTSSGFIALGQKYTLTFPKPGVYPYLCLIHQPVMTGIVTVQARGTPYPHPQSFYTAQGQVALNSALEAAQKSVHAFPYPSGGTTLAAGISPNLAAGPPFNATVLRFLDGDTLERSSITIAVGTTLTWVNQSNNEPHTVTFPILGHQPPQNPGEPASGGHTYDGTKLVNSGQLFPGNSFSLTFTKPGTYTYYCLFHDVSGMIGTVIVH